MDWSQVTRETYIGLTTVEKVLFYILILGSLGVSVWWYYSRSKLWKQGQPDNQPLSFKQRLWQMGTYAFGQKKVPRHKFGAIFHLPLYAGFIVLFIGTTLLFIAEWVDRLFHVWFHQGLYYIIYEMSLDLFGLGVIFGCVLALWRRMVQKPPSVSRAPLDAVSVWLLLFIALTGYVLEAARIALEQQPPTLRPDYASQWAFVGHALAPVFAGITVITYKVWWWIHAVLIAAWFASLAFNRVRHLFVAPAVAFFKPNYLPNVPSNESIEEIEKTGRVGVNRLQDFASWHLMSLDACMGCGRCERVCPAYATGKPLNPKWIVEKLRDAMTQGKGNDLTQVITDEELFACTTCGACNQECPVLIEHPTLIMEMRRHRVAGGNLRGNPANTLQRIMNQSNPWGLPPAERMKWSEGLGVPTVKENPNFELLFWVGCAGAYDSRGQQVARAIVKLLQLAGVNFAVLGPEERCSGDTPRRLGEDLLFQELALQNVDTLNRAMGPSDKPSSTSRRIMAMCPHCLHTIKNEYPAFEGHYEVLHHTQVLEELMAQGKLPAPQMADGEVVFHDPCYLGRVNKTHESPRQVLGAARLRVVEPEHNRDKTFCCGAGGGRMWTDEPPSQRPGLIRAEELLKTGAKTVAVGCPFCMIMISDSVKAKNDQVPVKDIAELLLERIEASNPTGVA
jgi:Fe-S oxidoreductase/nitrate reductase gamma subunit